MNAVKLWSIALFAAAGLGFVAAAHGTLVTGGEGIFTAQEPDGKALYLKYCRKCHGVKGEPSAAARRKYKDIKTLVDPEYLSKVSNDSMITVLKNGTGKDMKSFAKKMTPAEMAAVAEHVRALGSGGAQTSQ